MTGHQRASWQSLRIVDEPAWVVRENEPKRKCCKIRRKWISG